MKKFIVLAVIALLSLTAFGQKNPDVHVTYSNVGSPLPPAYDKAEWHFNWPGENRRTIPSEWFQNEDGSFIVKTVTGYIEWIDTRNWTPVGKQTFSATVNYILLPGDSNSKFLTIEVNDYQPYHAISNPGLLP